MKIPIVKIDCPNCSMGLNIPFFESLEAKAIEDYDMNETSAQSELDSLRMWLWRASLFDLLKYWLKRRKQ